MGAPQLMAARKKRMKEEVAGTDIPIQGMTQ
jgi:hypothetical protein